MSSSIFEKLRASSIWEKNEVVFHFYKVEVVFHFYKVEVVFHLEVGVVVVVVFRLALDNGVFFVVTSVSFMFLLADVFKEEDFFLTVGVVVVFLLAGRAAIRLDRELRLERGVGEEASKL